MEKSISKAFRTQKNDAKRRNISFKFSLEEWVKWWETNLGINWKELRGHKKGKYVMARIGDNGSYSLDNVECILHEQNCIDRAKNNTSARGKDNSQTKLLKEDVSEYFSFFRKSFSISREIRSKQK